MYLRELQEKDAELMLGWMHDEDVVRDLHTDFMSKTLDDCLRFIAASADSTTDVHRAIADDDDTYMGTVSLKHIDREARSAEFAITVRREAMGKGFSRFGMEQILRAGLFDLDLDTVYWCVNPVNARAVRFYEKQGYPRIEAAPAEADPELAARTDLVWYAVQKGFYDGK